MLDEIIYDIVDDSNEEESHENDGRNLDYGHEKSDSHEGSTAKKALLTMAKDLYHLYVTLNDSDDLPEWCHYKLATSRKDLSDVTDYITSKILKHCLDNKIDHEGLQEAIKLSMKSDMINENIFSKLRKKIFSNKKKDNITRPVSRIDPNLETNDTVPLSKSSVAKISNDRNKMLRKSNIILSLYSDVENSKKIMTTLAGLSNKPIKFKKNDPDPQDREQELLNLKVEIARNHLERPFISILNDNGYLAAIDKISSYLRHYKSLNENQEKDLNILKDLPAMAGSLYPEHKPAIILELESPEFGAKVEDFIRIMALEYNKNIDEILNTLKDARSDLIYIVKKISNFLIKKNIEEDPDLKYCMSKLQDIIAGKDEEKTYDFSGLLAKQTDVKNVKPKQPDIKPVKSLEERKKYSYSNLKEKNPYFCIYDNATVIADYYEKYLNNNIVSIDTLTTFYNTQTPEFKNNSHDDFLSAKNNLDNIVSIIDQLEKDTRLFRESYESNSSFENKRLKSVHKFLTNSLPSIEARLKNINICFSIINNCDVKVKSLLINDLEKMEKKSIYDLYKELKTNINSFKNIYEIIL